MTKPINLSDEFLANAKRSCWTHDMIFKSFTTFLYEYQSLDEWNQLAFANSIDCQSWQYIFGMTQGFNNFGEEIINFYPDATINPADISLNTIREFIDAHVQEFFYMDYGVHAHNLLLEFIIYLGVRLNTTFDGILPQVSKFITDCGMNPEKTSYPIAFEKYFKACDDQNLGTKKERNLHKFGYYSIRPMLDNTDFDFFCKLIYSANLCRAMNRFTLGALDKSENPYSANPFGFAPYPDENFIKVVNDAQHGFGTRDFFGVHYGDSVDDFQEGLLIDNKLDYFIKRTDLCDILLNPYDSYFGFVNIFLNDYLPKFNKFHKFNISYKACQNKIEDTFFNWAQLEDNQIFILDVISHAIENSDNEFEWYDRLNDIFKVDSTSTRLQLVRILDIERKSLMALNANNWQLLATEYHRFFEEQFAIQIKTKNNVATKSKEPKVIKVESNLCFQNRITPVVERKKFKYVPLEVAKPNIVLDNRAKTFEELFPKTLFVYENTKIEEFYLEQSNVRKIIELVSNAFEIAQQTSPSGSNILHRFIAITLFPDKFLSDGAIIPNGKIKVFQANQYPYFEGDCEIIASPKVRLFLRNENNKIRIVSFGNPNYH